MKIDYEIATVNDLDSISTFSGIPSTHYRETYFSNLATDSQLAIAKIDGEVVGVEGYVRYDLIIRGEIAISHRSEDTLVSPALRGKGVFKELVNSCSKKVEYLNSQFCWGTTPLAKAFRVAKFKPFNGYRWYVMVPISPLKVFYPILRSLGIGSGGLIKSLRLLKNKDINKVKELMAILSNIMSFLVKNVKFTRTITGIEYFEEPKQFSDLDDLHQRIDEHGDVIHIAHTEKLFLWVKKRLKTDHFMVCAYYQDRLVGYAFVIFRNDSGYAEVSDFCYENFIFFEQLMAKIKENLRSTNVCAIFFALNIQNEFQKDMGDNLKKYTKVIVPGLGNWVVRPGACKDESVYKNLSRWYLTDLWCIW
jgi:GNAT superfamily N-acetyltransferase